MNNMNQDEMALMLEMIMNGQQNAGEEDLIQRQYAEADALRAPDKLEMGGNGRIMVAPSALEMLGGLSQVYTQGKKKDIANTKRAAHAKNVGSQNQRILDLLLKMQQNQQPPVQPASGMPQGINMAAPSGLGLKMPQDGSMPRGPGLQAGSGMVPPFQM